MKVYKAQCLQPQQHSEQGDGVSTTLSYLLQLEIKVETKYTL